MNQIPLCDAAATGLRARDDPHLPRGESFHQRQGLTPAADDARARLAARDGAGRGRSLVVALPMMMFGPQRQRLPTGRMRWGIKRISNDDLRQKFIDATVQAGRGAGRDLPDPDLKWNEARGHYDFGTIDWDEFWDVVGGRGQCNVTPGGTQQGTGRRRPGAEAAMAHAEKQAAPGPAA